MACLPVVCVCVCVCVCACACKFHICEYWSCESTFSCQRENSCVSSQTAGWSRLSHTLFPGKYRFEDDWLWRPISQESGFVCVRCTRQQAARRSHILSHIWLNPATHYNHSHPIKVTANASNTLIGRPFYPSHFWQFALTNHLFLLAVIEEHFLEDKYISFCPIFIDGAQKSVSICSS